MSGFTLTISKAELEDRLGVAIFNKDGQPRKFVSSIVEAKNKRAFSEMMEDFENDDITREVEGGPTAPNYSNTLGGYGNLFSFIGFNKDDEPINNLRELLKSTISFKSKYIGYARKQVKFEIEMPNKDAIFSPEKTPMPEWNPGKSWIYAIEHGISGLNYYLHHSDSRAMKTSRSGTGIQIKSKLIGGRFSNRSYITALLNKYREYLRKS